MIWWLRASVSLLDVSLRRYTDYYVVEITGDETAEMSWAHYVRDVKLKYGVEIDGWTHSEWGSISHLTNSVKQLKILRDRLQEHKTKWVRISPARYDAIKSEYEKQVQDGEIPGRKKRSDAGKKRKRRSDAGKPRKKGSSSGGGGGGGGGEEDDDDDDDELPLALSVSSRARAGV